MAIVHREITIDASPEQVWAHIRDVGRAHELLSLLSASRVEGDRRVCTLAQGGELDERILSIDEDHRRLGYAIVDSPFDLEFHAASMQVVAREGGATLVWITDVKPDPMAAQIGGMIDAEVPHLQAQLAREDAA